MLSRVLRTIGDHGLVRRGQRVLVAVSGGPDSMALLQALWELAPRLGVTLHVASVDHGLRRSSAREVAWVGKQAAQRGLPFTALRVDVAAAQAKVHGSLQDAARHARLGALEALARRRRCDVIATGHHADDQAETVLFRIVRGTGVRGLVGIPYQRPPYVRPLLDVRRSTIVDFLQRRGVGSLVDPSNANPRFARSRLRHQILPLLRTLNPRVDDALIALAEDAALVGRSAPLREALELPRGARRVLERLRTRGHGTRSVDVRGGTLEVAYGHIRFHPRAGRKAERGGGADGGVAPEPVVMGPPAPRKATSHVFAGHRLDLRWRPRPGRTKPAAPATPSADVVVLDADAVVWPVTVRGPRPGDRMRPRGGRGSRKVQDMLVDAKVARPQRAAWPVLVGADGTILWLGGLRAAEAASPGPATRRLLEVALVRGPARRATPRTNSR